jgi:serine/threonine protein kinase/tetratricopeptide (TPR) repeat protein
MPLSPKTRLGIYEILGPLGAGGMGEVYRARDLRLGREVAVKVLPESVASSPERLARFEREARTVAGLNHPNIVTLHTVEDHGGVRFLTMELVEGQTLSNFVTPGGLPLPRILELSIPLSEALVAAHERGVTHRDLKPGNVMVTREGRVKVLDFGLAEMADEKPSPQEQTMTVTADTPVSSAGEIEGTVPYMAPEQLRGEAVDARSDLFALGIIVYELATGHRPFSGDSYPELISSVLRDTPEPLTRARAELPGELDRIVSRCLEKNPRERTQSARDVHNELCRLRKDLERGDLERSAPDAVATIAVLPFVNRSASAEDEYFSDGLADELLNELSKIKDLRVPSRSSSFHFKGKDVPLREIGRALKVANVLDGSVRKSGNRIRVSVQLVKVSDGYHLWSETYDRTLEDVFAVQDDIAQSVVKELRGTLFGGSEDASPPSQTRVGLASVSKERTYDPESYDFYLRGRYLFGTSDDGPVRAQELFRKAIERSPRFALAYFGLGESYVMQSWLTSRDREATVAQAKAALAKAFELDDRLSEARVLAGQIKLYFDWDWDGASNDHRLAIELNPGSDLARREYGCFLSLMGRFEEGLDAARRAQVLDPLSVNATHEVGYQLLALGRLEEAVIEFRKAIDLNPTWTWGNIKLGMSYSRMGEHDKALACVRRADDLMGGSPGTPLAQSWLAAIELGAGKPERARGSLARLVETARTEYVDPFALAYFHYALGDHDAMFESLERGYQVRVPGMVFLLQARPFLWRDVGTDARYEELIRRMRFPDAR